LLIHWKEFLFIDSLKKKAIVYKKRFNRPKLISMQLKNN
jgi:hypothetical protein